MFQFSRIPRLFQPLAPLRVTTVRTRINYQGGKQAHMMKKIISGKSKNKGFWYRERDPKPVTPNSLMTAKDNSKGASRRSIVLNKLFMEHVTDLMTTGEVSQLVLGHSIQITRVQMSLDFQLLTVYWTSTNTKMSHLVIEDVLKQAAGPLRHQLSQLMLMGEVPRVMFVADKQSAELNEVDRRLAIVDFGDDYEPKINNSNSSFTPQFRTTDLDNDELPKMRHDVFSLDHEKIMNRILASMSKTRSAIDRYDGYIQRSELAPSEIGYVTAEMAEQAHSEKLQNAVLLASFLEKRKIEEKRLRKLSKQERTEEYFDDMDDSSQHHNDRYEDDYDEYHEEYPYDSK